MNKFLTYLNTRQFFTNRWKGDVFHNEFYLSDKELQRWNITRAQLEAMPQIKKVDVNTYNVAGINEIDISLLRPHGRPLTDLHRYMMRSVVNSNLPDMVNATLFFKTFLKHRERFPEKFFTVDIFAGRVHTPISGMSRKLRPELLLYGEKTVSFDVAQMQPTLLGNILYENIGLNAFSDAINAGTDIYIMLQAKVGLNTRDEAKKLFYLLTFGKPSNEMETLFSDAEWINWINWYKSTPDDRNPRKGKIYNNLAWLLENHEVKVMTEIWQKLAYQKIPFLTVHDEIICRRSDMVKAESIIKSGLDKYFKIYKLNVKGDPNIPEESTSPGESITPGESTSPGEQTSGEAILSLNDFAIQLIGLQNNITRSCLLAAIGKHYSVPDIRAADGLNKMLELKIIEELHLKDRFMLKHKREYTLLKLNN